MKTPLLDLVRLYQKTLSPFWPAQCRYLPSCSQYAYEALSSFGAWKGGWLALRRLARCHPLGRSGYDPVPSKHTHPPRTSNPKATATRSGGHLG